MKINWGTGIAIFMFAFIVFILSFVYKTFTNDKYDHHLVSKEYYKDEMNYQQEIDAMDNAKLLKTNVKLENTDKGIRVTFPSEYKITEGTIRFQRASNVNLDFEMPIKLENHIMYISTKKLVKGMYNVRIIWQANNTKYQFSDKYNY